MKIKKLGALLVSAVLCAGMAAPAFAFEGEAASVEQPVLPEVVEEDVVTVTDETSGVLTPEGNLTLVDDYHTDYSDGSGQQFITLVSKSGATFYIKLVEQSKAWVLSPERKASKKEVEYAVKRLDGVIARITNAMKSTIQKIQTTLMKPEVKKAGTEQIKKKAKSSIIEQLSRKKKEIAEREVSRTLPAKSKKRNQKLQLI